MEKIAMECERVEDQFRQGLYPLMNYSEKPCQRLIAKTSDLNDAFLIRHRAEFSSEQSKMIRYSFTSTMRRFVQANLALDMLWAIYHKKTDVILTAIEFEATEICFDPAEQDAGALFLETALFQYRSYIDYLMIYCLSVCGICFKGMMSRKTFTQKIEQVSSVHQNRAGKIEEYFDEHIFGKPGGALAHDDWGTLVKSLRDRICHRSPLSYSYESTDKVVKGIIVNFPTLRGQTYPFFIQYIQNSAFSMWQRMCPVVWDQDWPSYYCLLNRDIS